jgi:hypothetical protein
MTVGLKKSLIAVLVVLLLPLAAFAKDAAVVVAKNSTLTGVHSADLTKAFKTLPPKWPDGREIIIVVKGVNTPEAIAVGTKLLGQSGDFLTSAAGKMRIIVANSDADVIKTVSAVPNSIGIVDIYSITGAVSVVKVDGKLPLEPGYLLHYN